MQAPVWKVHYFDGYARAESLRMLLSHAKVEYENVNYIYDGSEGAEGTHSWPEAKASGKFEFG